IRFAFVCSAFVRSSSALLSVGAQWFSVVHLLCTELDLWAGKANTSAGITWWPQRDSNPCFSLERAVSWASRRWGRPMRGEWLGEEDSNPRYRGQNPASYR